MPFFALVVIGLIAAWIFKIAVEESAHGPDLTLLGVLPMVAIPVSFGYCIARYRIMQIEALINRSLRYNLLTSLVILLYLICVLGLGALVL